MPLEATELCLEWLDRAHGYKLIGDDPVSTDRPQETGSWWGRTIQFVEVDRKGSWQELRECEEVR